MLPIAYYFLQVILCSGLMMAYYWLVLRNKRFHQYNRFYLLAIAVLSWIVPLIKIPWGHTVVKAEPQVFRFLSVVADNNSQIDETITQKGFEWNWDMLAMDAYFIIAGFLLIGMLSAFLRLYRLLKHHSCKSVGDVYLILTQAKGTPFSFFRYIFWNEEIDIRSESGRQILEHELTHVQQKHSYDKLFIQLMLVGGWFNPFFWLLRKEMNMIHEFIADKKAVNNGDTASLAQMLLTAAYPQQKFALTHPFFFSPIRRRLKMLTNNKNPRFSYIRRLVVLPLLAVVVVLFAFRSKERRTNATISVASVMENVVIDQKKLAESVFQGLSKYLGNNDAGLTAMQNGYPVYYNGRPMAMHGEVELTDFKKLLYVPRVDTGTVPAMKDLEKIPEPLMVIDGVVIKGNMFSDKRFSPADISSVMVWKDAEAVKRYGDEGRNGVIEVTTKSNNFSMEHATITLQLLALDPLKNIPKNRKVFVKNTIYQYTKTGTKVWEETNEAMTNDEGIYTVQIGLGNKASNILASDLSEIEWAHGPFFLDTKIAVQPSVPAAWWRPDANYLDQSTLDMASVPYAFMKGEKHVALSGLPGSPDMGGGRRINLNITMDSKTKLVSAFIIDPNATAFTNINYPGVKKGDPVTVKQVNENADWSVNAAWVTQDNVIDIKLTNNTNAAVWVFDDQYKVMLYKILPGVNEKNLNFLKTDKEGNVSWAWDLRPKPLVIVDGIKTDADFNSIDPNDVDRINVLKDKSAIEKYGEAAREGVIEIFTKKKQLKGVKLPDVTVVDYNDSKTPTAAQDYLTNKHLVISDPNIAYFNFHPRLPYIILHYKNGGADTVYHRPQVVAQFPGGLPAWSKYLERNLNRDILSGHGAPSGKYTVVVRFVVDKEGNLSGINAANDPGYGASEEAMRVIAKGPRWVPATESGSNVNSEQKQSITFLVDRTDDNSTPEKPKPTAAPQNSAQHDNVYMEAQFPGGLQAWAKYLTRNLDKDIPSKKGAPHGKYTVIVSFMVGKNGDISDVKAENDPGYGTKDEAMRMFIKGPKWKPAIQNGVNVANRQKQSITFFVGSDEGKAMARRVLDHASANTNRDEVKTSVLIPAEFPGGSRAWTKYLERNLDKDVAAKKGGPPGKYTVIVLFTVGKNGEISDVRATNDPGYGTKQEAIRVIEKGPKWKPAVQDAKNIVYQHKQVITFMVAEK